MHIYRHTDCKSLLPDSLYTASRQLRHVFFYITNNTAAVVTVSVAQRHNLIPCRSPPGDRLLADRSYEISFRFLAHVYSEPRVSVGGNTVHCVEVIDLWDDGTGGYAEITGSGVGHDYVKVKLTSQLRRGFAFTIKIYG
jgi:hypothetical protein